MNAQVHVRPFFLGFPDIGDLGSRARRKREAGPEIGRLHQARHGAAIRNVWINGACIGIELGGNTQTVEDTYINGVSGSGCYGIRVGYYTRSAATVDARITGSTIAADQANPADADLLVQDAGGLFLAQDDFLFAKTGTKLEAGSNQTIEWSTLGSSHYGDTNSVA
ncbi:hypothetical protein [Acidisoma sp. S159]|uniref:hypothetical protein n=1 Tax=Acidisoma sp. S159 TaxID=1747225 RepID=UPI001C20894F|nr:hypothetical protein [Acidisoma sp. S159]